jgi:polyhydroxyalkanoate synthesis repressor PhaR
VSRYSCILVQGSMEKRPMKPSTILIKKYGNRRLYDTTSSRYVNLDDLAAHIRAGHEVKVVDAKTGQDLTRILLTQIITEDAKDKPTGLPLELLRQLIIASDEVRQEFLMWYLKSAFDTYEKVQDAVQNRLSEVQSAILSPVDMMKRFLGTTASSPSPTDSEPEVEALRKRVAELEARLGKSAPVKRRSRKKH